ncbi:MAG TPA: hypothetical protein VLD37_01845 [Candidatus Bilamarchaeum sp.]|nr:hypothetical protein [Candidatus Bilamarchaeum sp.]
MARIASAAELDARGNEQTELWQQIRRTALDQVQAFCQRRGLEPAEFLDSMGLLRRGSGDWRERADWNRLNDIVLSNIASNRRGLDIRGFTRTLEEMHDTYVMNARPAKREEVVRRDEPAPQREEEQPAQRRPDSNPAMTPQIWSVAFSQADEILSRYPMLEEEHRTAIQNIVDRSSPENRRLVERDLRDYLRYLSRDRRLLSEDQAVRLESEIMVVVQGAEQSILALRRGPTRSYDIPRERRLPPQETQARAPKREFIYRFTVSEAGAPSPISTFEIASNREIGSPAELMRMLRESPAELHLTRIANDGRRIALEAGDVDLFGQRLQGLIGNDKYSLALRQA